MSNVTLTPAQRRLLGAHVQYATTGAGNLRAAGATWDALEAAGLLAGGGWNYRLTAKGYRTALELGLVRNPKARAIAEIKLAKLEQGAR